ncbi:DUF6555 family protein [Pseudomonas californiensis]|uniref:DUF6555 family protein n=1 Tax=Pseudomonas californiensis TaxID=2829823 RepID=UPI001E421AE6|nr:DUF6555 family protein [Pseudomonas californiensis]
MNNQMEFEVHYQFKGETRCFLYKAPQFCQSDALHCAILHAGVGVISDSIAARPIRMATLQAQHAGVTGVHWRQSSLPAQV